MSYKDCAHWNKETRLCNLANVPCVHELENPCEDFITKGEQMCINEIELLADVKHNGLSKKGQIAEGKHFWTSFLSGSTFMTDTANVAEVIECRNKMDYKFSISQLQDSIYTNLSRLDKERLDRLQNRLDVMIRQKGCLCKSDCFCNFEGSCKDCPNVNFSLDEEYISLA